MSSFISKGQEMLRNKYFALSLLIFAVIFFYIFFIRGFLMKRQPRTPLHKPVAKVEEKKEESTQENFDLNKPFKIEEISSTPSDEWGRDIFLPVLSDETEEEVRMLELPKLTAIVRDSKRTFAILNGKIVKEGERIDGILVKKILENSVIIDRGAGEEHVYIFNLQKGGQFEKNN